MRPDLTAALRDFVGKVSPLLDREASAKTTARNGDLTAEDLAFLEEQGIPAARAHELRSRYLGDGAAAAAACAERAEQHGLAHSQDDLAFFESIGIKADRVAAIEKAHNLKPYIGRMGRAE